MESYKNDYVEETPYQKGDWTPIVFLATYGTPSDIAVFNHAVQKIKEINKNGPKLRIYLLHGDERKTEPYNSLTENIHLIKEFDASIVKQIISFVGIEIECEYIHDDSIEFSPERVNNDSTEKLISNNEKPISENKNIGILPPGMINNIRLMVAPPLFGSYSWPLPAHRLWSVRPS